MKYSHFSSIRCVIYLIVSVLLTSCSFGKSGSEQSDFRTGSLQASALVERFGQIIGKSQIAYLEYVRNRLTQNLAGRVKNNQEFKIVLLNTNQVIAIAPGAGIILVSKGLALSMGTESEFAFAIAHEMSHQILGHTSADETLSSDERKSMEFAADKLAVSIMAAASYDPNMALYAIRGAYHASHLEALPASDYPDPKDRMAAITEHVKTSGWQPPGTVDRRDFQKFRLDLAQVK